LVLDCLRLRTLQKGQALRRNRRMGAFCITPP
jgi:hypothetical protein